MLARVSSCVCMTWFGSAVLQRGAAWKSCFEPTAEQIVLHSSAVSSFLSWLQLCACLFEQTATNYCVSTSLFVEQRTSPLTADSDDAAVVSRCGGAVD